MLGKSYRDRLEKIFNEGNPLDADEFFNTLNFGGLGRKINTVSGKVAYAYESLEKYENVLSEIFEWNKDIYQFIHKGTPFYFCGIHSFDLSDYERAIFYFDSALSEDLKNKSEGESFQWDNSAAKAFYILNEKYGNPIVTDPINEIVKNLKPLLTEFSDELGIKFSLEDFINRFATRKLDDENFISIIPTFYLFVYESKKRLLQLKLRSDKGGSIEPFILHLFTGTLIFETLLKLTYPSIKKDLGALLCESAVKADFNYSVGQNLIEKFSNERKALSDIIEKLQPLLEAETSVDKWFTLTYSLRNITSHNLLWPDKFDLINYEKLFKSIVYSILYIIYKKY